MWDHDLHGLIVRVSIARVSMRVAPSLVEEDPRIGVVSSEISGTHKSLQKAGDILMHLTVSTRMSRYGTELSHWYPEPKDGI